MLSEHVGGDAGVPTADEFIAAFVDLCGPDRGAGDDELVRDAAAGRQRGGAAPGLGTAVHEPGGDARLPASDHFEGVGVLSELVALSHELRMEEMQSERFPLPAGRVTPADVGAAEGRRPTASACARSCA